MSTCGRRVCRGCVKAADEHPPAATLHVQPQSAAETNKPPAIAGTRPASTQRTHLARHPLLQLGPLLAQALRNACRHLIAGHRRCHALLHSRALGPVSREVCTRRRALPSRDPSRGNPRSQSSATQPPTPTCTAASTRAASASSSAAASSSSPARPRAAPAGPRVSSSSSGRCLRMWLLRAGWSRGRASMAPSAQAHGCMEPELAMQRRGSPLSPLLLARSQRLGAGARA